jgi:hypothetical protein
MRSGRAAFAISILAACGGPLEEEEDVGRTFDDAASDAEISLGDESAFEEVTIDRELNPPEPMSYELASGEELSESFAQGSAKKSRFVHWRNGTLEYAHDSRGNRIPDFSNAGYGGGGVRIPRIRGPVVEVRPGGGDDVRRIQRAIDEVGDMPKDARGFRGVVLLRRGTYQIPGGHEGRGRRDGTHIVLDKDGVVLRGEGSGSNGTILLATRTDHVSESNQTVVIELGKHGSRPDKIDRSLQRIKDNYVPVGATTFEVEDASAFSPGDRVIVERVVTRDWIEKIGMDSCAHRGGRYDTSDVPNRTCLRFGQDWEDWHDKTMKFDRVIVRVDRSENRIKVDAPITQAIDREFGGGNVFRYRYPDRVTNVAIEELRGDSRYERSRPDDHAWNFIVTHGIENAWIREVKVEHMARSLVTINDFSHWMTVEDCSFANPVSTIQGSRRYPFAIQGGQLVLVQRSAAEGGRHSFMFGSGTLGPNVYLFCESRGTKSSSETHGYWNTGGLWDNVVEDKASSTPLEISGITVRNEGGNENHGHGWAGANTVLWSSRAPRIVVEDPPTASNWAIGNRSPHASGDAKFEHTNDDVDPRSLYLAQLRDRLGRRAVENIQR